MTDGLPNGGTLTPGNRFDRMEVALKEIHRDVKEALALKADTENVHELRDRVRDLEYGKGPLAEVLLGDFRQMKVDLAEVVQHGSQHAQELDKQFSELQRQVTVLRAERDRALGAQNHRIDSFEKTVKITTIALSVLMFIAVALSAIVTVITVLH